MPHDYTPQRVVSLQPSVTQIMECLGLLDRVVACTRHCRQVCPSAGNRMLLEDSWTAQSAEIIAARPDLVIAAVPFQAAAVLEILKAGARFLALAPRTLADIYGDISTIAQLFGRPESANAVIEQMQAAIEEVRLRTAAANTLPVVYCEEWGKPMLRSQPWVAELVAAAGGSFWGEPGKATSAEEVARADPDVIITAWCGAGDRVPLERIARERGWTSLRAVRNRRVYCVSDELLTTPAPILVRGLGALAGAIHPHLCPAVPGVRQIVPTPLSHAG